VAEFLSHTKFKILIFVKQQIMQSFQPIVSAVRICLQLFSFKIKRFHLVFDGPFLHYRPSADFRISFRTWAQNTVWGQCLPSPTLSPWKRLLVLSPTVMIQTSYITMRVYMFLFPFVILRCKTFRSPSVTIEQSCRLDLFM